MLALLWGLLVPVGEAPDEGAHIRYAEFLRDHHHLPAQADIIADSLWEGHQAPLYYAALSVILSATGFSLSDIVWTPNPRFDQSSVPGRANLFDNSAIRAAASPRDLALFHLLRVPNALLLALTVWWLWRGLVILLGGMEALSLLVTGVWAFAAQTTFMGGVVGNDMPAAALSALAFLYLARAQNKPGLADLTRAAFVLALAILTKMTVVFLLDCALRRAVAATAARGRLAAVRGDRCGSTAVEWLGDVPLAAPRCP